MIPRWQLNLFRVWLVVFTAIVAWNVYDLRALHDSEEREDTEERLADCEASLNLRAANADNDAALVRDIADAVAARGSTTDPAVMDALVADIAARINQRVDRLPPPAVCVPLDDD